MQKKENSERKFYRCLGGSNTGEHICDGAVKTKTEETIKGDSGIVYNITLETERPMEDDCTPLWWMKADSGPESDERENDKPFIQAVKDDISRTNLLECIENIINSMERGFAENTSVSGGKEYVNEVMRDFNTGKPYIIKTDLSDIHKAENFVEDVVERFTDTLSELVNQGKVQPEEVEDLASDMEKSLDKECCGSKCSNGKCQSGDNGKAYVTKGELERDYVKKCDLVKVVSDILTKKGENTPISTIIEDNPEPDGRVFSITEGKLEDIAVSLICALRKNKKNLPNEEYKKLLMNLIMSAVDVYLDMDCEWDELKERIFKHIEAMRVMYEFKGICNGGLHNDEAVNDYESQCTCKKALDEDIMLF